MSFDLSGRVALVTGSGRGIGAAIATRMAEAGARVALVNRTLENAEAVAAELREGGAQALAFEADLSSRKDCEQAVAEVAGTLGGIDILVHNAGVCPWAPLAEITDEALELTLAVNLKACFWLTQAAMPHLRQSRAGRIIITSSVTGPKVAMSGSAHYAASKGGVNAFVRAAALELAADRITVNGIEPGFIAKPGRGSLSVPATRAKIEHYIPLGEMGRPDDIAFAAVYLASPGARYMTGQILTVDGGGTLPETGYAMDRLHGWKPDR
jgi:3-oxoacyl-[acyl-carrier protein] reductase